MQIVALPLNRKPAISGSITLEIPVVVPEWLAAFEAAIERKNRLSQVINEQKRYVGGPDAKLLAQYEDAVADVNAHIAGINAAKAEGLI